MCTENLQFGPGCSTTIIQWIQTTYPVYEKFETGRSFFYHDLSRHKKCLETTSRLEPQRDKRGENRVKTKRGKPLITQLCM